MKTIWDNYIKLSTGTIVFPDTPSFLLGLTKEEMAELKTYLETQRTAIAKKIPA